MMIKKRLVSFIIATMVVGATLTGCISQKAENTVSQVTEQQESEKAEQGDYKERVATKMGELFRTLEENKTFSGYVLVGTADEIVYSGGCGYADFKNKIASNQDTKFKVGSIQKQFVATAIMQLQEQGKLEVNDKLSKFIPDFPYSDQITLHQLLTHSSGLETSAKNYDITHYIPGEGKKEATGIKRPKEMELLFKPGEGCSYSNVGYILLSFVVEKVSGKELNVYLEENVFQPLEMTNTGYILPETNIENFAIGYLDGVGATQHPDLFEFSADQENATGFFSCAADLYKWNQSLHSGKIIKPETQDIMLQRYNESYGYGWKVIGDPPNPITYTHDGATTGYNCRVIKTSEGISIIILSNYQVGNLNYVFDKIIPILVDEE